MARASSKSSGNTRNRRRDTAPSGDEAPTIDPALPPEIDAVGDSPDHAADGPLAEPLPPEIGMEPPTPVEDPGTAVEPDARDTAAANSADKGEPTAPGPAAEPARSPAPAQTAAGIAATPPAPAANAFWPMILGGLVAAGIGYGAAYMGLLPSRGPENAQQTDIAAALAPLQAQIDAMTQALSAASAPTSPPAEPVDLGPVLDQIAGLSAGLTSATDGIATISARLGTLESRPVLTGDVDADTAAMQAAAEAATAALAAELEAERAAAAARALDLEAAAQAAAAEAAAAQAAIAEAEAQAAAALALVTAEAAVGQLQTALATGQPFAEPLARIAVVTPPPQPLSDVAETGVATLAALQSSFPPLARAALPVALRESAGDSIGQRLGAFVMGQIGGRSIEPRAGDDPDAVLSRVEAAVRLGDLTTALDEINALPEGARAVLAPWVAQVEARAAAEAGLATLTAALGAASN